MTTKLLRMLTVCSLAGLWGCEGPVGDPGAAGEAGAAGTPCYEGLTDQNGDGVVDALDCRAPGATNTPLTLSDTEIAAIEGREGVQECIGCHKANTPNMVWDFVHSKHGAKAQLGCTDCHAENPEIQVGQEGHRFLPTPETCKKCHAKEYEGHRANRHSIASIRDFECGRFDDFPRFFENGAGYHFTEQDVLQLKQLMDTGNGAGSDANPTAVAKCMSCHNVENKCDSCHTRHRFSPKEARKPSACATCHMGPDHPQYEMYKTSKHGTMYDSEGDTKRVPVCVDCHMPYNGKIFDKKTDENGKAYVEHDLSKTIAYGPVGGGTVRAGFVVENNRVKFVNKGDANDTLWYDWADRKVYDSADGNTVAYEDLWTMSTADKNNDGVHDYKVAQPVDDAAKLKGARSLMLDVCKKCHAPNFADERLLIADLIHENVKLTDGEALDIVAVLAATKIGPYGTDDRPINPENGTNNWAANMKVRNLTDLERVYFHIMKYDQVKTWKGGYHFNPDYTHWYGWTELNMRLGQMGDMATQQVLQYLWMKGKSYPGANANPLADGLYQGVLFANGISEKSRLENYYDKTPGPADGHLDWWNAQTKTYTAPKADGTQQGDGIPDNEQDIDLDMDGSYDLVKDDGKGGKLGPGVYRAVASGKVLTFH